MENDTSHEDFAKLKNTVKAVYLRKKNGVYALCKNYAEKAKINFRRIQALNKYWKNKTGNLLGNSFSDPWVTNEFMGFFLSLTEDYGKYVILANNRKHDALTPIMNSLYKEFIEELEKIYAD